MSKGVKIFKQYILYFITCKPYFTSYKITFLLRFTSYALVALVALVKRVNNIYFNILNVEPIIKVL